MTAKLFKLFFTFIFAFTAFSPSFAGEDEEEALKAFGNTFIETTAKEFLKREADKYVAEKLAGTALEELLEDKIGEEASENIVSDIFAAYNLYKGIDEFDSDGTQSQKYYQTMNIIGSVVSFINPAIGTMINLGNLFSQIATAAITKGRVEDLMRAQEAIVKIYKDIVETQKKLTLAELKRLNFYFNSYFLFLQKTSDLEKTMQKDCGFIEPNDFFQVEQCFQYAVSRLFHLKQTVYYLNLAINYSHSYLNFEKYLEAQKIELTMEQFQENVSAFQEKISSLEAGLDKSIQQVSSNVFEIAWRKALATGKARELANHCIKRSNDFLFKVNQVEVDLIMQDLDFVETTRLLTQRERNLVSLLNTVESCQKIESVTPIQMASLINKYRFAKQLMKEDLEVYFE